MGKGDKRSKKGKLWIGTRGKKRPARPQNEKSLLRNKKAAVAKKEKAAAK